MKIVIELSDGDLHRAIEAQIGKAVALATNDVLSSKIDEVIAKKFDRIDAKDVQAIVGKAAADLVRGKGGWELDQQVRTALANAAKELVRNGARNLT